MSNDQDGCETVSGCVFLLVPAYPGCPGPKAVKRLCVCVCVCGYITESATHDQNDARPMVTFAAAENCPLLLLISHPNDGNTWFLGHTQVCPSKWHLNQLRRFCRAYGHDRQQTDRQRDRPCFM